MHYVYLLKSSIDGSIFYVGKGSGNRMYKHVQIARNCKDFRNTKNPHLYAKISKIIRNDGQIIYDKIFESLDANAAYEYEKNYIDEIGLDNLTNIVPGGLGGHKVEWTEARRLKASESAKKRWAKLSSEERSPSDETRKKLSDAAKKNKISYWKGKTLSAETKQKMSDAKKGKKLSDEHKNNLSKVLTGRKLSDEHKKNLSEAKKN